LREQPVCGIEGGIVKKAYFILLHIVIILLIAFIVFQRRRPSGPGAPDLVPNEVTQTKTIPVITAHPTLGDIKYRVTFTGEISGEEEATLFSDVPGRFLKFLVAEGQYVNKQTPVALIEREIPGLEFEPAQVEAPISGVISRQPLESGEAIAPQTPIARIAKIRKVKVLFQAPEPYAAGVTTGKEITAEVASLGQSFTGKIAWVSTFLDPTARTVSAYALISNSQRSLKPGMFAKVALAVEERMDVLTVPSSAVLGFKEKWMFVAEDGKARRREVKIGLDDGTRAEIVDGVTADDVIIVVGQEIVEEGDSLNMSSVTEAVKTGD
jgi:multidrug efflux pump subunit AcrA (membrane-fusion protein)